MKRCYLCEVSEEKAFLYEGVAKEGFVHVCRGCYVKNEIPLIETKKLEEGFEKKMSVRERLMGLSGVRRPEIGKAEAVEKPQEEADTLKKIIEKNFKENVSEEKREYDDLVENFHWIIMRRRRILKLSQENFAKAVYEPTIVIEHMEKKVLPKDYVALIKKVQSFLRINLFKNQEKFNLDPTSLASESKISTGVTISDMRGLHEQKVGVPKIDPEELNLEKVEELVGKPISIEDEIVEEAHGKKRNWFGFRKKSKEIEESKDEDISQEEIEDIMFRRDE